MEAFIKHDYKKHVHHSMDHPELPMSRSAMHWPAFALAPPAAQATGSTRKPVTTVKKWTIKWLETGCADPGTMCCTACNAVSRLYDDAARAVDDSGLEDKLARCRARTMLYMGHLLRCSVQTRYIARLVESVVHDPAHVHMCVDYKVRKRGVRVASRCQRDRISHR